MKQSQYDTYELSLDIKKILLEKNSINNFILSNLEKKHPRFSAQCYWQKNLSLKYEKKDKKWSLKILVVVLDKFLLSKILQEKRCKVYIEKPYQRILFKNQKILLLSLVICILIASLLLRFVQSSSKKELQKLIVEEKIERVEETNNQITIDLILFWEKISSILSNSQNNKPFIENFSYEVENQRDYIQRKVSCEIKGFYPEKIEATVYQTIRDCFDENLQDWQVDKFFQMDIKAVTYEKDLPKVKTEFVFFDYSFRDNQNEKSRPIISENSKELIQFRNFMISNKMIPMEEQEDFLSFEISKKELASFFASYFLMMKEKKENGLQHIRNIDFLKNNDFSKITVNIVFSLIEVSGLPLAYDKLFNESFFQLISCAETQNSEKIIAENISSKMDSKVRSDEIIVGKIVSNDGNIILLEKNKDGKISYRRKDEK